MFIKKKLKKNDLDLMNVEGLQIIVGRPRLSK